MSTGQASSGCGSRKDQGGSLVGAWSQEAEGGGHMVLGKVGEGGVRYWGEHQEGLH